jgi:predicted AAA+ superfamily ATPase
VSRVNKKCQAQNFLLKKLFIVISQSVSFTPDMKRLKKLVEFGDERTLKNYLKYLEDKGIIIALPKIGSGLRGIGKPGKRNTRGTGRSSPEKIANPGPLAGRDACSDL